MRIGLLVVIATAVALGACSDEAEIVTLSAGGSAHAGTASRVPARPRSASGGGEGGTAGVDVAGLAGTAGAAISGGSGGTGPGVGGMGGESTADLGLLPGNTFLYHITHEWQSDGIGEWPEDSEYVAVDVDSEILVTFSSDATSLQLTEPGVADSVDGQRTNVAEDRAQYELDLFAGGYFAVWVDGSQLAAEHTITGSGVRVISSTRGVLLAAP